MYSMTDYSKGEDLRNHSPAEVTDGASPAPPRSSPSLTSSQSLPPFSLWFCPPLCASLRSIFHLPGFELLLNKVLGCVGFVSLLCLISRLMSVHTWLWVSGSACCGRALLVFPVSRPFRLCRVHLPVRAPGGASGEHTRSQRVFTSTGRCQTPPGARGTEEPRNGLKKSKVRWRVWCAAVYDCLGW